MKFFFISMPVKQPKSTATVWIAGAILVIARFNPFKKIGPRFGRTLF
jgi:hypothetical protein